ncbi:MAG TPA: cytochrome c peroxidase, partial [Burkholderiales bacterium]|nr:cytochrome c peroxidase [Burkholderiales bacterium]
MIANASQSKRTTSRIACAVLVVTCARLPLAGAADERVTAKPHFTDSEIRIVLSHGPWPATAPLDPSNRASGKQAAIEFGTRLFFDQRLSGRGTMSCASCHVPERNWTDNQRRGAGLAEMDRNTPTLMNLVAGRWYGWDGAADSLWFQSLRPILDRRELASTPRHVAQLIRHDGEMSCHYRKAYGAPPSPTDDEGVLVNVGKALAAFQETLTSGRTPFDHFRDALARGAPPSTWTYSEPAQRGLKIFIGKGGCTNCHAGPNFTGGEFFNTGLSRFEPLGQPDAGRHSGIGKLLESRFNLLGPHNDDATGASAARTRQVSLVRSNFGEFKVPSLRNLHLTSPYGRDGSVD